MRGSESVLHNILIEEAGEGRAGDSHGNVLGGFFFSGFLDFSFVPKDIPTLSNSSASQPEAETGLRRVYMSRQC